MSIHIVIGPMYAGKTSRLVQDYMNNESINKIIVDYDICGRNETQNNDVKISSMETHDGIIAPNVYKIKNLNSLYNKKNYMLFSNDVLEYNYLRYETCEHIYINEAQFLDDLKQFVINMVSYNKTVHIYGLDADYKQEKIGQIWDLIPYASSVKKLTGKCSKCLNRSIVSHRTCEDKQVYLPNAQVYEPLCLKCYSLENDIFEISM